MSGNFKFEDEIELNGLVYFVEVNRTAYGNRFVDYDDGYVSCDEFEIDDVDIEELKISTGEDYEEEVTDEKIIKDIEKIIQYWVEDGSIELGYVD